MHYWARKRYVLPGIIFANLAVIMQGLLFPTRSFHWQFWVEQLVYWIPIIVLMFTRKKWVDVVLLIALCLSYLLGAMILGW